MRKRIISFFTALSMTLVFFSGIPIGVSAEIVDSGECGAQGGNVTWSFDDSGVLTISGTGAMADYDNYPPWGNYFEMLSSSGSTYVTSVVIEEGVTHIGTRNFFSCMNSTFGWTLTLPETLTSIGDYAFTMSSVDGISLPSNLQSIGTGAFACTVILTHSDTAPVISIPKSVKEIGELSFVLAAANLDTMEYIPLEISYYESAELKSCTLEANRDESLSYIYSMIDSLCSNLSISDIEFTENDNTFTVCEKLGYTVNAIPSGIAIDATNFPDANFRQYVLDEIDKDGDGSLSDAECRFRHLDVRDKNIADLTGIEFFTNLTMIYCFNNQLTSLDLSKNTNLNILQCYGNQLTSLNLSQNTGLTELYCQNNKLTALDVSNNTKLNLLYCYGNELDELDVSANTELATLYCHENNLNRLDLSNNTNLNDLNCCNNQIEELDISKCGKLTALECRGNELDSLDLSQNTELNAVYCLRNNIGALDISSNKKITILDCSENQLKELDVTNNTELLSLYFNKNQITEIDVSQNTKLTGLYCQNNKLTALDVSNNTALERLSCGYNRLSSMDVSNINLNYFSCGNNEYSVSDCCLLDPASLPGQFDLSKAKNMTNCKLTDDGKILYLGGTSVIQYYYDCGLGESKLFNIAFPNPAHSCAKIDAKDATCEDEGNIEYWHCSKCGYDFTSSTPKGTEALVEDTVIPPTDHSYGSWKITAEPTLTSTGTAERVCENDSAHTETKELPALTDTTVWTKDDTQHVDPTEETEGKDVYTSDYGDVEVVLPVKPHNHVWDSWTIVDKPTLTEKGTAERICTKNSEHTETKELPALTDTTVWTKDDTQHVDPTEETEGKDVYTSDYGDVEVVLPVKPHTHSLVKTEAQAATCTTSGNKAYWTCSGCNKMFSDENGTTEITAIPTIPAAGHTYSPDWSSDDTYHWHASTCGHTDAVDGKEEHIFIDGKCKVCQKPDPNYETPTDTSVSETQPPETDPSDTESSVTQPPETDPSDTEPSVTQPPETDPSDTESSVTQPPETDPSDTESSDTQPPVTDPSDTESSDTQPPVTDPSDTEPSVTQPPVTEPPVTQPTATNPPYIPSYPPSGSPAPAVPASREPFLQDENGKIGWAVISDDIWATHDGETVRVNMNGTAELPKNIVSDIAGRDIDLVLIMNKNFTWTINGTSVTKAKTVDMNVRKISKIPRSVVQDFFGDSKTVQLDLRHNGDFGFTAELTVDLGEKYSGLYANSYCYRARNFEFGDSAEIMNGQAKLRFTHASSWLITVEDFPAVEDVSSASAAHSAGTPIDMSNSTSVGVTVPEFDEKRGLKLSNRKRRYCILKKHRLDDLVFVL